MSSLTSHNAQWASQQYSQARTNVQATPHLQALQGMPSLNGASGPLNNDVFQSATGALKFGHGDTRKSKDKEADSTTSGLWRRNKKQLQRAGLSRKQVRSIVGSLINNDRKSGAQGITAQDVIDNA